MVLVKFVAFVLFEVVSFSCQTLWMQITADVGKISKTVPCDLKFIFDELSEYDNNFLPNLIFLVSHKMTFLENESA